MLCSRSLRFVPLLLALAAAVAAGDEPPCPSHPAPPVRAAQSADAQPPAGGARLAAGGDIDVTSDRATVAVDGDATLSGNVQVRQGERRIRAEEVQYDAANRSVKSDGAIDYADLLVHVAGQRGSYSPDGGADFNTAQFELLQRPARGAAQDLELTPEGVLRLKGVTFTTCPVRDRSWELRARDITLDTRTKVGYGHAAEVAFKGIPLMYLPWLSFPLGNERKSGFLFPLIGNNSRSGLELSAPFYWNIAPNADLTFEPTEYSRRGPDLGGDFRYLTAQQRGELDWNYLPSDSTYGAGRSRVRLRTTTDLQDALRLNVQAENVSDSQYFEDFAQGPEGTSTAFVERRATLSYRDVHWRVDGEAQQFQTIDNTLAVSDRPYTRMPRLFANADFGYGPGELLHYGFDSEVVDFQHGAGSVWRAACLAGAVNATLITSPSLCGATGWRLDVMPAASLALDGPGFFAHPTVAWRATQYQLTDLGIGADRSPRRTLPVASFDTGLLFDRQSGADGERTLTLEPRLMYLYVPYRNQDALPVFDTALPDLNPVNLFRPNRYVGADRMSDANQLSVAVTSRLLNTRDGRQFLTATLGEAYYFEPPRVALPYETLARRHRSDIVAQLAVSAFQNWTSDFGLQWNPETGSRDRIYANIQYRPAPDRVLNLGYRFQRDILPPPASCALNTGSPAQPTELIAAAACGSAVEQAEVSGAWPLARSWNLFLREVYSIRDQTPLESFAGFEYRACCWGVRFGGRRFVARRPGTGSQIGGQDTGVFLELELIGLASVGSASDAVLMENIRGYAPADSRRQSGP